MIALPPDTHASIRRLCREFDVEVLALFGSAARAQGEGSAFDPADSDFDFLVAFKRRSPVAPGRQYLGLLQGLEELLGRKVDLVDLRAASNPYFIVEALKHRVSLYAA